MNRRGECCGVCVVAEAVVDEFCSFLLEISSGEWATADLWFLWAGLVRSVWSSERCLRGII